jgi:hypothetical protein
MLSEIPLPPEPPAIISGKIIPLHGLQATFLEITLPEGRRVILDGSPHHKSRFILTGIRLLLRFPTTLTGIPLLPGLPATLTGILLLPGLLATLTGTPLLPELEVTLAGIPRLTERLATTVGILPLHELLVLALGGLPLPRHTYHTGRHKLGSTRTI